MRLPFSLLSTHAPAHDADAPPLPRRTPTSYLDSVRRPTATGSARLGCAVVRRLTDDDNREWHVREMGFDARVSGTDARQTTALLFRCETPGIRSEIRRGTRPLESMSDDELLLALQRSEY